MSALPPCRRHAIRLAHFLGDDWKAVVDGPGAGAHIGPASRLGLTVDFGRRNFLNAQLERRRSFFNFYVKTRRQFSDFLILVVAHTQLFIKGMEIVLPFCYCFFVAGVYKRRNPFFHIKQIVA